MMHALRSSAAGAAAALVLPAAGLAQVGEPIGDAAYDSVFFAWEAGRYADALQRLERLLTGPSAERYLEPAAILTGELYRTIEAAPDGRALVWSSDGRHMAWETGSGAARHTHIAALEGGTVRTIARVEGHTPVFDGARRVLYIAIAPSQELTAARAAVDRAVQARDNQAAFQARTRVSQLEAAAARLIARDLTGGRETTVPLHGIVPQTAVMRPGDTAIHVLGAQAGAGNTNHVFRIGARGAERITTADGPKGDPVFMSARALFFVIDRQSFAVQDAVTGETRTYRGTQPSRSADGSHIAFVRQDGDENVITVVEAATGATRDAVRRRDAVAAPALSSDGRRLVFQAMPREDWELYVTTGDSAVRLTREIQHDLMPRFLDGDRVFALMGEARHRRSYLYDVGSGRRTRLFHNNTVRTVAPEYEWALSPDRTKLLVVADRDGDTVSPERGVYLVDLTQRVTVADVLDRVRTQLAGETALRARGAQLFAGIEPQVQALVADVSTDRVYRYEYDLYQFDSKFITQPGNGRAIEYLVAKLREFGYEPELQWFEARGVRTANVIAALRGTVQPDVLYTVSSHFDSVERGPGADDDTSGTAALLEVARVLATRPQPATIHFAFFTGEEAGLLGSREYVRRAVERGDRLVGALNNDMIGFANDQRLDNTIRYSNDGIRDIQHAAAFLFTDLITYDAKYYRSTDAHAYYEEYGDIVGGIGSYPILGNPHYHQTHDQLETVNHRLIAEVAKVTAATLVQLTNTPSRVKNVQARRSGASVQLTWEPLPELDVRRYVVEWGPAGAPARGSMHVTAPQASITGYVAGDEIRVSAENERGAVSWDWARIRPQ